MNHSIGTLQKKTRPFQRISTLVAILFVIALVGSFVIVTKLAQHVPPTGSPIVKPIHATPTLAHKMTPTQTLTQTITHNVQSTLYIATLNGLYAINFKTGKTLWHVGSDETGIPSLVNGTVYFAGWGGSGHYYLDAVNATDGTLRWHNNYSTASFQIENDILYANYCEVQGPICHISALNASNGTPHWNYTTTNGSIWMKVQNGVIYVISYRKIFALNATTGTQIWQNMLQLPDQMANMEPMISNGVMYFASCNVNKLSTAPAGCYLYAYNATNGNEIWHYHATTSMDDEILAAPAIANNILYYGTGSGSIYAVDSRNGNPLWHYNAGDSMSEPPLVVGGVIYAEVLRNNYTVAYLIAIRIEDRSVLWTQQLFSHANPPDPTLDAHTMVIYHGLLYTILQQNSVAAFSLQNGSEVQLYQNTDNTTLYNLIVTG